MAPIWSRGKTSSLQRTDTRFKQRENYFKEFVESRFHYILPRIEFVDKDQAIADEGTKVTEELAEEATNTTREAERRFEERLSAAEDALEAAALNFTSARSTFLAAAKEVFPSKDEVLYNSGDQTIHSGDLTVSDGSLKVSDTVSAFTVDIDTLTGHAWGATPGNDGRVHVALDGQDGVDLPGCVPPTLHRAYPPL